MLSMSAVCVSLALPGRYKNSAVARARATFLIWGPAGGCPVVIGPQRRVQQVPISHGPPNALRRPVREADGIGGKITKIIAPALPPSGLRRAAQRQQLCVAERACARTQHQMSALAMFLYWCAQSPTPPGSALILLALRTCQTSRPLQSCE